MSDVEGMMDDKQLIKSLQDEVLLLKKEIKRLESKSNVETNDYGWATLFEQEEIDYFIQLKISQEMTDYYFSIDITQTKLLEEILDYVHKGTVSNYMPGTLKESLSLGLMTKDALPNAISIFLELVRSHDESGGKLGGMGFEMLFGDSDD